jgi:hypothetical protein
MDLSLEAILSSLLPKPSEEFLELGMRYKPFYCNGNASKMKREEGNH